MLKNNKSWEVNHGRQKEGGRMRQKIGKTKKIADLERRQCGKCGLIGDWERYIDGSLQAKCPHCGAKYGSQKIS